MPQKNNGIFNIFKKSLCRLYFLKKKTKNATKEKLANFDFSKKNSAKT